MRHRPTLLLFLVAAACWACWLAAGPGGATLQAVLACRHHAMHQSHGQHHPGGAPTDGPCFCDEMTGGLDLAVSVAVPAPLAAEPTVLLPVAEPSDVSLFPLPSSPSFAPVSPPPNGLA